MSSAERAKAIVNAIDGGIVAERPRFRDSTVLACQSCGHRFAIVNDEAAKRIERSWSCKCGGTAKIVGYWARLEPRSKEAKRA